MTHSIYNESIPSKRSYGSEFMLSLLWQELWAKRSAGWFEWSTRDWCVIGLRAYCKGYACLWISGDWGSIGCLVRMYLSHGQSPNPNIPQPLLYQHRYRISVIAVMFTTTKHALNRPASSSVRPHRFKSLYSVRYRRHSRYIARIFARIFVKPTSVNNLREHRFYGFSIGWYWLYVTCEHRRVRAEESRYLDRMLAYSLFGHAAHPKNTLLFG